MKKSITYTYGDSNWKDKLTKYGGTAITYDAIGNPLSDGTWTFTWEKGRQLQQMSKTGTTATFKYNSEGLRVQKTVNGTVTNYTLHGKNIVHMTQGSNTLHFWYDAGNRPAIVQFNGTKYAYIHNLQGDIVGILNTSGTEVVKYTYDAWGKVLSTTGSLAATLGTIQPFRYRGYVYDVETGLYYLRSRYYNPHYGRFISADIIINNKSILKQNLFTYCINSPISQFDASGKQSDAIESKKNAFINKLLSILNKNNGSNNLYSSVLKDILFGNANVAKAEYKEEKYTAHQYEYYIWKILDFLGADSSSVGALASSFIFMICPQIPVNITQDLVDGTLTGIGVVQNEIWECPETHECANYTISILWKDRPIGYNSLSTVFSFSGCDNPFCNEFTGVHVNDIYTKNNGEIIIISNTIRFDID